MGEQRAHPNGARAGKPKHLQWASVTVYWSTEQGPGHTLERHRKQDLALDGNQSKGTARIRPVLALETRSEGTNRKEIKPCHCSWGDNLLLRDKTNHKNKRLPELCLREGKNENQAGTWCCYLAIQKHQEHSDTSARDTKQKNPRAQMHKPNSPRREISDPEEFKRNRRGAQTRSEN
jgi:hypothetical protein